MLYSKTNKIPSGITLKKKIIALSIVLLLTTMFTTSIIPVHATSGGWFTSYEIRDANTNAVLASSANGGSILPGAQIKIVFTVNVPASGTGDLTLQTSLERLLQDKYWELQTQDYTLGNDFNGNTNNAKFNWLKGTFTMVLYAKVPSTAPDRPTNMSFVKVLSVTGETLDQIVGTVVTANVNEYQSLLDQANGQLATLESNGAVIEGFTQLYGNVIQLSQTEYAAGDVNGAKNLLAALNVPIPPKPVDLSWIYIPVVGVLAVVAVISLMLFFRTRGKIGYYQLVVEDQIRDLEGLTMRAAKIDRAMSSNLNSVKEKLKNLVGV
jgi:hypothetical protein